MYAHRTASASRRGFTLIEILIVVILLGVLGSIIIPQLSGATTAARESTLREDLRYLRTQIGVFKLQHRDVAPGYPGGDTTAAASEADFLDHMTKFTDERCAVSATETATHRYGPYLTEMPPNPLTGKKTVLVVVGTTMPAPDESQSHGWIYNAELQKILPNKTGIDTQGVPYTSY